MREGERDGKGIESARNADPHPSRSDAARFRALVAAYNTLKDPAARALYDASLLGGAGAAPAAAQATPGESFDDAFERWWRRQGFDARPDPGVRRAARQADAAASAAAWAADLKDAAAAKARFDRSLAAARAARAVRHAAILKRAWVARPGFIWQDAAAAAALAVVVAGVALSWPATRARPAAGVGREGEG